MRREKEGRGKREGERRREKRGGRGRREGEMDKVKEIKRFHQSK